MLTNLHTHTRFSDGSDEPIEYIREAARQGFSILGFTDHSPVPFENTFAIREGRLPEYCDAILGFKSKSTLSYQNLEKEFPETRIPEILLGLEIDFIPGMTTPIAEYRKSCPFDYVIGSIHLIRGDDLSSLWFIDGPDISIYDKGLNEVFHNNVRKAITAYYRQVNEMVEVHQPDIVGHLDKVKMYNRGRYFSEADSWYLNLIDESLELIKQTGCVIEVNTRGLYKKRSDSLFPGPAVLKKVHALNIPVTVCSDAHKPQELSLLFSDTCRLLKEIGFSTTITRSSNGWVEMPL